MTSFILCTFADTELVGDDALEEVEEALELEEDDGIKLEPFNLAQERQEGFFDDEGHYVEKRDKEEEEAEKDAWFSSTKGEGTLSHGTSSHARMAPCYCRTSEAIHVRLVSGDRGHHISLHCTPHWKLANIAKRASLAMPAGSARANPKATLASGSEVQPSPLCQKRLICCCMQMTW